MSWWTASGSRRTCPSRTNGWTADGRSILRVEGHAAPLRRVLFSPDGKRVLTVGFDGAGRLWDAASGAILASLDGHEGPVVDAAWSVDGSRIATASYDRTGRLWDAASGGLVAVLRGHEDRVGILQPSGNPGSG